MAGRGFAMDQGPAVEREPESATRTGIAARAADGGAQRYDSASLASLRYRKHFREGDRVERKRVLKPRFRIS